MPIYSSNVSRLFRLSQEYGILLAAGRPVPAHRLVFRSFYTNSSNRQSELQWTAIDRRAKGANWASCGALSRDGSVVGGPGQWLAGNELAIETSNDSSQPYVEVGTRYDDCGRRRRALNIEYHSVEREQLTRDQLPVQHNRSGDRQPAIGLGTQNL